MMLLLFDSIYTFFSWFQLKLSFDKIAFPSKGNGTGRVAGRASWYVPWSYDSALYVENDFVEQQHQLWRWWHKEYRGSFVENRSCVIRWLLGARQQVEQGSSSSPPERNGGADSSGLDRKLGSIVYLSRKNKIEWTKYECSFYEYRFLETLSRLICKPSYSFSI